MDWLTNVEIAPEPDQPLIPAGTTVAPTASAARSTGSDVASLVTRAAAGDREAWDRLVDRFASMVWAIARAHRLSPADAADVSQTTWLRLVENLGRINQPDRIGAWLATTARRESLRVIRLAGRQVPRGEDLDLVPDPAPTESQDYGIISNERSAAISALVRQLPVRSQLLLRLLSADVPFSYRDISEALDMPIGSIGPTRARALEQLRRLANRSGLELEDLFTL